MKLVYSILLSIFAISCIQDEHKNLKSEWILDDWIPIIVVDNDTANYFNFIDGNIDTLNLGNTFNAKLYFPIREFFDSLGNNIITENHKMEFYIYPDTMTGNTYPPMVNLKRYLEVVKDTGYLNLPVDSIYSLTKWDSVIWHMRITPTEDSTFAVGGKWIVVDVNPSH